MNMSKTALFETQYLPPIEFFCCILDKNNLQIEASEHFQKQTYRNRCYILGANKVQQLSIPVEKGNSKTIIKDLKIDLSQNWHKEHWRSIKSAYGRAPFFEYYAPYFEKTFEAPSKYLLDFNINLLTVCLDLLGLKIPLKLTEKYRFSTDKDVTDYRSIITPKEEYAKRSFFKPQSYIQVFGKDFVPNLSVIDLLMNEGPSSLQVVTNSKISE